MLQCGIALIDGNASTCPPLNRDLWKSRLESPCATHFGSAIYLCRSERNDRPEWTNLLKGWVFRTIRCGSRAERVAKDFVLPVCKNRAGGIGDTGSDAGPRAKLRWLGGKCGIGFGRRKHDPKAEWISMRKHEAAMLIAAGEMALEPPGGRRRSPRNCLYRLTGPNSGILTGTKVDAIVRPCAA